MRIEWERRGGRGGNKEQEKVRKCRETIRKNKKRPRKKGKEGREPGSEGKEGLPYALGRTHAPRGRAGRGRLSGKRRLLDPGLVA